MRVHYLQHVPFVERDAAKLCDPTRADATKELLYRLLDAAHEWMDQLRSEGHAP